MVGFGVQDEGCELLVLFVSPFMWTFLALIGMSLIRVRRRALDTDGGFQVPLYPLLPIIFIGSSIFMVYRSLSYLQILVTERKLLDNSFFLFLSFFTVAVVLSAFMVSVWSSRRRK